MGPAQASLYYRKTGSIAYHKQIPTAPSGYGPAKSQGVPLIKNPDTGPYFRAITPKSQGSNWALQNPTGVGLGYNKPGMNANGNDPDGQAGIGAERELVRYGRPRGRSFVNYAPGDGPGVNGPYHGLGLQPREALPTARTAIVARTGNQVVGGNIHAFMPPPDKYDVVNLWQVAPPGTAWDANNRNYLTGTTAPQGNG